MGFGTDAGVYPHGDNWKQFPKMVEWGMKPIDAIRAATLNGADIMGWSDRVGSIEKGYYADIVGINGDPLADISAMGRVKIVIKGGEVVRNDFGSRQ
jgi:imidazolonepropionase-like amidohydrolase